MSSFVMPAPTEHGWIEYPHDFSPTDQVQNYCLCKLCHNPFLLDLSGSPYCGRELCVAVRMNLQKHAEERVYAAQLPVA